MSKAFKINENNFRIFLKNELSRRCKKNPAYSLRSFAKMLGISHTALSQIIANKRSFTSRTQKQVSERLSLSPEQLVQFQIPKNITFEEQFKPAIIDDFDIYSDWVHDAILELTRTKFFKPELKWLAQVLDVSLHQVSAAIDRLKRAGLLEIDKKGRWHDRSKNNTTNHLGDFTNSAFRKYQKELIEKSVTALENTPREARDHTSLMLCFSKENMKEAKKLIQDFRTRFSIEAMNKQGRDVYVLSIAFFPISNTEENL